MRESGDIRGLMWALGGYVIVFAAKLAAYFASGVVVLFAEALHTLSDIFISAFLLVAAIYSRRQADERYMFGYGRAQNIAALVAATLFISLTSFELYRDAIPRLFASQPAEYENLPIAVAVIVGSMIVAAIPLFKLFAQKNRGAAAKAQLIELVNDQLGLLAALAGVGFILLGYAVADPIAAIVVATIIAVNALALLAESASFLLGRAPSQEFIEQLHAAARSVAGVVAMRDLRAEYVGPDAIHAGLTIEVDPGLRVDEAARIAEEVRRRVHEAVHPGYCYVQLAAASARPTSIAAR